MSQIIKPHLVHPGDVFGRFTVVEFSHNDKRHRRHYVVRCVCGVVKTVQGTLLRTGNTRSCGCLSKDVKASKRKPGNAGEITAVILGYRRHAKGRGLSWSLARGQVEALIRQPCGYCGSAPENRMVTKNTIKPLFYNGIDRVDNSKGYEPDNVVPCCRICNQAKGTLSVQEFHAWATRVAAMATQWGGDVRAVGRLIEYGQSRQHRGCT